MEIIVYSKSNCPNCLKVKKQLDKFDPKIVMLDTDISRDDFFKKFPNIKSLPQIIIDNKLIGGYYELEKWLAFNVPEDDF